MNSVGARLSRTSGFKLFNMVKTPFCSGCVPVAMVTHSYSETADPFLPACTVIYQSSSNHKYVVLSSILPMHLSASMNLFVDASPSQLVATSYLCYSLTHNFNLWIVLNLLNHSPLYSHCKSTWTNIRRKTHIVAQNLL